MLALERRTGFAAADRVPRLLEAGGASAVLEEVRQLQSDYVRSLYLRGSLDLAAASGSATACSRDAVGAVENWFRVAVSHLLLPRGGFLLHAMAVLVENIHAADVAVA